MAGKKVKVASHVRVSKVGKKSVRVTEVKEHTRKAPKK